MANRPNMKDDIEKKKTLPKDNALANTSDNKKNKKSETKFPRQTYYIPTELKRAIDIMAATEMKEKSEVVRELLYKAMPKEYLK